MTIACFLPVDNTVGMFSAKVYGAKSVEVENNVDLKCSISGFRPAGQVHLYLCKNGVGISMKPIEDKDDYIFTLHQVTLNHSGNYSCMYTTHKYVPNEVKHAGENHIFLQVNSKCLILCTFFCQKVLLPPN